MRNNPYGKPQVIIEIYGITKKNLVESWTRSVSLSHQTTLKNVPNKNYFIET